MKKVFFVLVFALFATLAFANSNENSENDLKTTFVLDYLTANDISFDFEGSQISYSEYMAAKECTLRGKFTITFSDGSSYSFEGTLTIVGLSCAEFLKELMA